MKYFVKKLCPSSQPMTRHFKAPFCVSLDINCWWEQCDLWKCLWCDGTASPQTIWLVGWAVILAWRENVPVLSQLQAKMAFSQTTHKKKKSKQRKIAGGMKHNAKSKTSVFLGSASLASIIHLWQNPCRSWGGEKTRKYTLYVSVFAPFSVVPLHRHGNRRYIYVLHRPAPSKINANL